MTAGNALAARLRSVVQRWEVAPVELGALAALLCGALMLLGVIWWLTPQGAPEPMDSAEPAAEHDVAAVLGDGASEGPLALDAADVVVHVTGAVEAPGLHRLPGGARIADAIEAAGGAADDAVLDGVNLARPVRDGEQLHVPDQEMLDAVGDDPAAPTAGGLGTAGAALRPDGRVDLNRADAAALEALPGVGPVLAERIISYRDAHGPFTQPDDLLGVSGIGERTYEALAELVDT